MSLGPDSWCLPGDWPRHKLRAYGRLSGVPGGAEYRRLLNFLSKNAAQGEREILNVTSVPQFAQVPPIVNRRIRAASEIGSSFANRLKSYSHADTNSSGSWTIGPTLETASFEPGQWSETGQIGTFETAQFGTSESAQHQVYTNTQHYATPQAVQEMLSAAAPQPLDELCEPPRFGPPTMPASFSSFETSNRGAADLLDFAPDSEVELSISFEPFNSQYVDEIMQNDFAVSVNDLDFSVDDFLASVISSQERGSSSRDAGWKPALPVSGLVQYADEPALPVSGLVPYADESALQVSGLVPYAEDPAHSVNALLASLTSQAACQPTFLNADVPANIVERVAAEAKNEDGQFLSHLSVLLNEWFDKENAESNEDTKPVPRGLETPEQRRERTYALLKKVAADKLESKRLMEKMGDATASETSTTTSAASSRIQNRKSGRLTAPSFTDPSLLDASQQERAAARHGKASSNTSPESRRRARNREQQGTARHVSFLSDGMRKEESGDGSFVLKDAVGRVTEARSHDGVIMSFSYDNRGHLKSFVRSDVSGKIHTTGVKDKHGVIVRDEHGSLRAQGDSMTVDTNGCVSIRKFDGQFWSLDVQRGIHIERRILEDGNGNWNCLTALLTCDGFRMVTRFQKLQENKRESYRKYGDWLGSNECSKFRFYGRDGSMIEFENDEDLQALRPARIWSAGTRSVDREWVGRRQAGTAWDAVHRYVSQYLSAL